MTKDEALKLALSTLDEVRQETFRLLRDGQKLYAEDKVWSTIISIKEVLAQPEQEPVAWQFMNGINFRKRRPDDFDDLAYDGFPYWKPLYTTPPQRTWVGLTKEEIAEFDTWHDNREEEIGWVNPSEIVAYIEAKLKQKNGIKE